MNADERSTLGARIKQAVMRSGLSREEIARQLKARGFRVTSGHLRRWMHGEHAPRVGVLTALADVTKQEPDWLFGVRKAGDGYAVVERPPANDNVTRFGRWMVDLPDDVRAFTYFIGEVLSKKGGLARFSEIAAESLARMETSSSEAPGTGRTRQAAATRAAKQKKASGR